MRLSWQLLVKAQSKNWTMLQQLVLGARWVTRTLSQRSAPTRPAQIWRQYKQYLVWIITYPHIYIYHTYVTLPLYHIIYIYGTPPKMARLQPQLLSSCCWLLGSYPLCSGLHGSSPPASRRMSWRRWSRAACTQAHRLEHRRWAPELLQGHRLELLQGHHLAWHRLFCSLFLWLRRSCWSTCYHLARQKAREMDADARKEESGCWAAAHLWHVPKCVCLRLSVAFQLPLILSCLSLHRSRNVFN